MIQVTIAEAEKQLAHLIDQVLAGEEVLIARGMQPLVRLTVLPGVRPPRRIGGAADVLVSIASDFDQPLPEFTEYEP
jgi:antitoxin (DNA-binding transcriptional repressor) of toxin-antitoxin stability system